MSNPARAAGTYFLSAAALLSTALLGAGCKSGGRAASGIASPGDVSGRYLLAIGDADLPADGGASAADGGLLSDRTPRSRDTLTVVSLPIREPSTPSAQITVPNSFLSPPGCVAVSADGRWAFVLESRGAGEDSSARPVASLPAGENLSVLDLGLPMAPKLVSTTFVGREPQAIAIHPSGTLLAVTTRNPHNQLVIIPAGAKGAGVPGSGEPVSWPLLGLDDGDAAPSGVAWHPTGKALGLTLPARSEAIFYGFRRDPDGGLAVASWGDPVRLPGPPIAGMFTPDGRHFIALSTGPATGGMAAPGQVSVIRVASNPDAPDDRAVVHELLGSAPVGLTPVGAAVSADSSLIAVANTQAAHATGTGAGGSITLLALGKDGSLSARGEYLLGAAPAGISFDTRGGFVLVSQYRSLDPEAAEGEVSFWKVRRGPDGPSLQQQDFFVGIGSGPHGALIVR